MSSLLRIPRVASARRAAGKQLACYSSSCAPPAPANLEQSRQDNQQNREMRTGGHGRVKKSSPSQRRERDTGNKRFTSSAALHIMRQDKVAFKPIPVHPRQAQLHMALTPSHMPLKLNLGTSHLEVDPSVFAMPATHYALKDLLAYPSEVRPDRFFEKGESARGGTQLKELNIVNGHIAELLNEREGFSPVLNEHQTWSGSFDAHRVQDGPAASVRKSSTYSDDPANALVSALLPQPSAIEIQFNNVLSVMEAAQKRLSPSTSGSSGLKVTNFVPEDPHSALMLHEEAVRAAADKNRPAMDLAVSEVEDLLDRLAVTDASLAELSSASTGNAFVRRSDSSLEMISAQRGVTFGRWAGASPRATKVRMMVEEEGAVGDFVWMDSVKRKRKKKISKHKCVSFTPRIDDNADRMPRNSLQVQEEKKGYSS